VSPEDDGKPFASSTESTEVHTMPRNARRLVDGLPYHVLNRGNRRQLIFSQSSDYETFLTTLADALVRIPVATFGYSIMPNHFHLVLWAERGVEISAFMGWLMNTHIRRYHRFGELWGTGHLYQGRFKAFPIQTGHHLLTVLRYVEANPLRARLVARAEDWPWSSLTQEASIDGRVIVTPSPVRKPDNWTEVVNESLPITTCDSLRTAVRRQVPFGDPDWIRFVEEQKKHVSSDPQVTEAEAES
jgi:putative transposase